jgi:hypothetical protein
LRAWQSRKFLKKLLRKKTHIFQTLNKTHTILNVLTQFPLKINYILCFNRKMTFCAKIPKISTTPNTQKTAIFMSLLLFPNFYSFFKLLLHLYIPDAGRPLITHIWKVEILGDSLLFGLKFGGDWLFGD